MGDGVALFPAAPVFARNADVEHPYRQHSDLYYLSGLEEPEALLLLTHHHAEYRSVIFLRSRDPQREQWEGYRVGVEDAPKALGVDVAFDIDELDTRLPQFLAGAARLHYSVGEDPDMDERVLGILREMRTRARSGGAPPHCIVDLEASLHTMRRCKGSEEQTLMRHAATISTEAHRAAMQHARPGRYEYQLEAIVQQVFTHQGSRRPAYESIVGSGPNATVLHYRDNRRQLQDGDLVLIDAGCEYLYYAADITRTFPANGRFSKAQRALYEVVLHAQKQAIAATKPGVTLEEVHRIAVHCISEGLLKLGILKGKLESVIKEKRYLPFFMHRTSHWLGMDVHDVGDYWQQQSPCALEQGFVFTIEPGIYVRPDMQEVDPMWRGIGIRIEDDILVTNTGYEVLSADVPKEVEAIERWMAAKSD